VDKRADIWAFGVVLYEMLVGGKLFGGETATDIIASVVKEQPDWARLPEDTPRVLRSLLRRCLVKDPRQRLRDIGDARLEIEQALSGGEDTPGQAAAVAPEPTTWWRHRATWALATTSILVAATLGVLLVQKRPPDPPVLRFDVPPPKGGSFALNPAFPGPVRVSPDGRMLAYTAFSGAGEQQLFVRALDEAEARALPGTEGARYPFWSADSRHIAFFASDKLKRIEAAGGPPLNLCNAQNGKGGSWARDGTILFAPSAVSPIHQVSDAGGESTAVTALDESRKDDSHRHPRFLPDGRRFLYLARHAEGSVEGQFIVAASLDGGEPKTLLRGPAAVEYASGHLFFLRDQTLMAQPFDADRLELTGEPRPLVDPVALISRGAAHAVFSVSPAGALAWQAGGGGEGVSRLVWRDRHGEELGTVGEPGRIAGISLSPKGDQAVAPVFDPGSGRRDLWLYEMARGLGSRFTFDAADELAGVWSPDGESLVFSSNRDGVFDLYRKSLGGSTDEELLYANEHRKQATGWHPDGQTLAFSERSEDGNWDILLLPLSGDRVPRPFVQTPFREGAAVFSPDGRWVAYHSAESGEPHVYVQPFPGPGRKWQVSTVPGLWPRWRRDGREIVYQTFARATLMAAPIETRRETLVVGTAVELFETRGNFLARRFDLSPDGQRLLLLEPAEGGDIQSPISVLVNWPAALAER
jgi:Tol biopolymer transport system component